METSFPEMPQAEKTAPEDDVESAFIVGASRSMKGLERVIRELAGSDMPVLLMAEPGAGKRRTAQYIHRLSQRREQPFLVLAAAQLTTDGCGWEEVSERFFRGGTIYLDEIGVLSLESQQALLALLGRVEDNGNQSEGARLICGTARDLEVEVREGRFREDLHYRVSGLSLRLPPLRQRKEDIPHLLTFFLKRYAVEFHCPIPSLSAETQQLFLEYSWPGNLHELEEAARVIVMMGDEALAMGGLRSLLAKSDRHNGKRVSLKEAAKAASREAEKELILRVLTRTRWNRRRAAEELQISYKALLYKLKQIGYGELGGAS
jgi:two-component system, NtrC family, response regulator AtoC